MTILKQINSLEKSIKSKFNKNKYKIELNTKADFCTSFIIHSEYESCDIEAQVNHCLRINLINSCYQTIIDDIYVNSDIMKKSKEIINENLTLDLINEYEHYFKLDEFDINIIFELKLNNYFNIRDFGIKREPIYSWANSVDLIVKKFEIKTNLFNKKTQSHWRLCSLPHPEIEKQFNLIIKDFKKQLTEEELELFK